MHTDKLRAHIVQMSHNENKTIHIYWKFYQQQKKKKKKFSGKNSDIFHISTWRGNLREVR